MYGLLAEFETPEQLLAAAQSAYASGYRRMDAYSPQPVEGLADALGHRHTRVPLVVLIGGIVGCVGGYLLQWWCAGVAYPQNIGGRPLNSWPAWIPIMFEMTVLVASFAAVLGMLGLNGLPMPYHPLFNVPAFAAASRNRFFLCIESRDPRFSHKETARFLHDQQPLHVFEVPP